MGVFYGAKWKFFWQMGFNPSDNIGLFAILDFTYDSIPEAIAKR